MILPFDHIGYKRLSENKRLCNHRWYSDATWREKGWMLSISACCQYFHTKGNKSIPADCKSVSKQTLVQVFDWKSYFETYCRKVPNITRYHHFPFDATIPGLVFIKEFPSTEEKKNMKNQKNYEKWWLNGCGKKVNKLNLYACLLQSSKLQNKLRVTV